MSLSRRTVLGTALALPAIARAQSPRALRIGIGASLNRLDPLLTTIGDEYIYCNLVFNGLTRMAEDQTIHPDLAASWTYTDDLKRWTFRLRPGIKFHDGTTMVAADVVALFQRLLEPATNAPSRSNYDMVSSVEAPDDLTVVFTLASPYGGFADILSDRQVKITPRAKVAGLPTQPIGTGPFRFVSYTPGDRLVLERFPEYFEPGLPKLPGVELRIIPEMSSKLAALQSGELDVVWDLPLDQVKPLQARAGLTVESVASGSWDAAVMNNLVPPFNDPRVRRAFNMAVGKADVVELTLFGQGAPTISPIPPTHPFYATNLAPGAPDPAGAKRLLAEAGMAGGVRVPIIVPAGRPGARAPRRHAPATCQARRVRPRGAACAVQQLRRRSLRQGPPLYRRLLRPPHHRHLHLPLPPQHRQLEREALALHQPHRRRGPHRRPPLRRPGRAEDPLRRHAGRPRCRPVRLLRLLRQLRLRLRPGRQRHQDPPHALVRPAGGDAGVGLVRTGRRPDPLRHRERSVAIQGRCRAGSSAPGSPRLRLAMTAVVAGRLGAVPG